jgi:hypothetical protein
MSPDNGALSGDAMSRVGAGAGVAFSNGPENADEFFRSVRGAFERNESNAGSVGYAVLALIALVALVALLRPVLVRMLAQRTRRERLSRLVRARGLTRADVDLLGVLAGHTGTHPFLVATHIDVFERSTAAELRGITPTLAPLIGDVHDRVRALRGRLGFDAHAEHEPLLTTRELRPGDSAEIFGVKTTIAQVTEARFSLVLSARPDATLGAKLPLTVLLEREASYSVACLLLGVEPAPAGYALSFAHDEAPARRQNRRFVRVPANERVELVAEADANAAPERWHGTLIDVSLQGAALSVREKLAVRALLRASFSFRGETFEGVRVVVLECEGSPSGPYRVRLEFRELSREHERKLAAAIARATTRKSVAPTSIRA